MIALIARDPALVLRILVAAIVAMAILLFVRLPEWHGQRTPAAPVASLAAAEADALPLPPLPDPMQRLPIEADAARQSNARVPIADDAPVAALPFHFSGAQADRQRALDCLALAAWYEAGDDPAGERAVVQVVLNRVHHPAFPDSACAVVFQGSERATGCQFTFTCDGALTHMPPPAALARARAIAAAALNGAVDAQVGLATHYHADYVVPKWRDGLVKIAQQGAHLFYRWPGRWGSPAVMARGDGAGVEAFEPAIAALSDAHRPQIAIAADLLDEPAPPTPAAPPATAVAGAANGATGSPAPLEIAIDPAAPPGSYALKALALCGRTGACRVAGRVTQEIAFLYVRNDRGEGAYWDCARFHRADRAQCLPSGTALDRLLATG